jgi:hypothetical protein
MSKALTPEAIADALERLHEREAELVAVYGQGTAPSLDTAIAALEAIGRVRELRLFVEVDACDCDGVEIKRCEIPYFGEMQPERCKKLVPFDIAATIDGEEK